MKKLLSLREREVYLIPTEPGAPQVYYLVDRDAGGVLINTPPYTAEIASLLTQAGSLRYLFFPSRLGAHDVDRWREETRAESLAYGPEAAAIAGKIDLVLDNKNKLTRTIGFLPMSGRTEGSCALYLRNLPGAVFFGPILTPSDSGWPTLVRHEDDYSFESCLFGSLGLQDVKYEYAFTDVYVEGQTRIGPGADKAVQAELVKVLDL